MPAPEPAVTTKVTNTVGVESAEVMSTPMSIDDVSKAMRGARNGLRLQTKANLQGQRTTSCSGARNALAQLDAKALKELRSATGLQGTRYQIRSLHATA
jgi:hypothetical protein